MDYLVKIWMLHSLWLIMLFETSKHVPETQKCYQKCYQDHLEKFFWILRKTVFAIQILIHVVLPLHNIVKYRYTHSSSLGYLWFNEKGKILIVFVFSCQTKRIQPLVTFTIYFVIEIHQNIQRILLRGQVNKMILKLILIRSLAYVFGVYKEEKKDRLNK